VLNPDTNKESTIATDFSFTVWGKITADYLVSIKKLEKRKFQQIFDSAQKLTRHSGKYRKSNDSDDGNLRSNRADLKSESESDEGNRVNGNRFDGNRDGEGNDDGNESADNGHGYGVDLGYPEW